MIKIAILGTRGIPAQYGGFETVVEQLGGSLVIKGFDVTVYAHQAKFSQNKYKGIKLVKVPSLKGKSTETLSGTFLSSIHVLFKKTDIVYIMSIANAPFAFFLWIFGKKVIINVNGLEWKRKKWGKLAKNYLRFAAWLCTKIPIKIITDSRSVKTIYKKTFNRDIIYLTYGAYIENSRNPRLIEKFGIQKEDYHLVVCRLEPENNVDLIVDSYNLLRSTKRLVIIGKVNYPSNYVQDLKSKAGDNILFLGSVYEEGLLKELVCNSFSYLHGHEVGGTNPSLLKAMGCGCRILALDVSFNREVLAETGLYFKKNPQDLTDKMKYIEDNPDVCGVLGKKAQQRVKEYYNWDKITDQYIELFNEMVGK